MKSIILSFGAISFFALFFLVGADGAFAQGAFDYQPLEQLPGASDARTFPQYIEGIYKFGIWTVGLAALFMLSVGGFVYLSSGGNTATIGKAKTYITDSLIGLVLAILAYLILYVINPDLVTVNLGRFSQVGGSVLATTIPPPTSGVVAPRVANEYVGRMTRSNVADCTTLAGTAWPSDAVERTKITPMRVNASNCGTVGSSGCTSLSGMPNEALSVLQSLAAQCYTFDSSCKITITGGTEYWLHGNRCKSATYHKPGNPVFDIGKNSSSSAFTDPVKGYLAKKGKYGCTYKSGGNVYVLPVSTSTGEKNIYLWEEGGVNGDHWHASLNDMCR